MAVYEDDANPYSEQYDPIKNINFSETPSREQQLEVLQQLDWWFEHFFVDQKKLVSQLAEKMNALVPPIVKNLDIVKEKISEDLKESNNEESNVREKLDDVCHRTKVAKDSVEQARAMGYQKQDVIREHFKSVKLQREAILATLDFVMQSRNKLNNEIETCISTQKILESPIAERDLHKAIKNLQTNVITKWVSEELHRETCTLLVRLIRLRQRHLDFKRMATDVTIVQKAVRKRVGILSRKMWPP